MISLFLGGEMANTSAVRNTCFAILSAIETDLRELIQHDIAPSNGDCFLPIDVKSTASARHAFDHKNAPFSTPPIDIDLINYMDFGDLAKLLRPAEELVKGIYGQDAGSIADEIDRFVPARNRVCHSRPLEDEDFSSCLDLAKTLLNNHTKVPWNSLRVTQRLLADNPGSVVCLEIPEFWQIGSTPIRHNLPLPDYDETGFLGRLTDRREVRKHLLAAHPVITIVGEGGVGKSALAVHCLYDLLNQKDDPPYEAIIWTSLKTKTLTALGASEIKDSITSTLGIIESAARELGVPLANSTGIESAIQDILEYMKLFRILLVVDNYETVTDNSLRPLLTSVPTGSKVLLTSRVGLGELEIRYKLDPLDLRTSVSLLRRFAKSLNVELLFAASEKKLERYCQHLYFNPLLIKWYVQSVSFGSDPEKLIAKGNAAFDDVLRYCFENLFSKLGPEERKVLHFLAAARRPLTPTELLFLMQDVGQIEPTRLDQAISTLHGSSMLKRAPLDSKSREGTVQLSLTDVSSDYIARFVPPEKSIFEKIQVASKKLRLQVQLSSVRQATYKFDLYAVRAATNDQRISAFHLNTALQFSKSRDFTAARKCVVQAKALLPAFAEAYRISSLIETRADEVYRASQEIEEATQLSPDSALIHYQFAIFLTYHLEDYDRALIECEAAIKFDPKEEALITMKALILTRLGRYSEAAPLYDTVLTHLSDRPPKWRISTRDQAAECYRRFGEQDRTMRNGCDFRLHIDKACSIVEEAMAVGDIDRSTGTLYSNIVEDALFFAIKEMDENYGLALLSRLSDASHVIRTEPFQRLTCDKVEAALGPDSKLAVAAKEYMAGFDRRAAVITQMEAGSADGRLVGKFRPSADGRKFGFVLDASGAEWFLVPSFLTHSNWEVLREGTLVQFTPEFDMQRRGVAKDAVVFCA
jgi:LuxR family glucitol operon transcriptional activator